MKTRKATFFFSFTYIFFDVQEFSIKIDYITWTGIILVICYIKIAQIIFTRLVALDNKVEKNLLNQYNRWPDGFEVDPRGELELENC